MTTPVVEDTEETAFQGKGAGARPLTTWRRRAPSLAAIQGEIAAQLDRWPLWAPVAYGGGSALYFDLMDEPSLWLASFAAAAGLALVFAARRLANRRALTVAAALLAFLGAGFLTAKVRTVRAAAPIVPALQAAQVEGWVVDVAPPSESGQRLVIAPVTIQGVEPDALPNRIRVTIDPEDLVGPGAPIRLRAGLNPPPPPSAPGAYDFARGSFFDGVGGVGFAMTPPQFTSLPRPPAAFRLLLKVNEIRWGLTLRVQQQIGGAAGGLAAAMITGQSAFVDLPDSDAMRDAGISHIISISGLHMAIVGGFAFFAVRLLLAAVPWIALRLNAKKAAAVAGLIAISVYLVVSGAPPAAERAAITAAVAFGAILADRRAVTLRGLALAALIVIALQPEAVTEPGFQMSFAATTALVALAEAWPRPAREINTPWQIRLPQAAMAWVGASIGVSFVAGLATAPFVIQHFNRVAVYSLPANLLTAPLSSFVFMPALAIGAVLEPIGLGRPFLLLAGWGVQRMLDLAAWIAALPGASMTVASAPGYCLALSFFGVLWLCLWRGKGRWLGLPLALAVMIWPRPPTPDAWAAHDGGSAAVALAGKALLMRPDTRRFASDLWARRRGLEIIEDEAVLARSLACERWHCRTLPGKGPQIAGWWTRRKPKPEQLAALCAGTGVFVLKAEVDLPASCAKTLVLRPADFERGGAAELYRDGGSWRVVWAQDLRGRRPWTGSPPR